MISAQTEKMPKRKQRVEQVQKMTFDVVRKRIIVTETQIDEALLAATNVVMMKTISV